MIIEKFGHKLHFGIGSSTGHPEFKGMQTCDIREWWKLDDFNWFKPYGGFRKDQIINMIEICRNESQLICLFELLSADRILEE